MKNTKSDLPNDPPDPDKAEKVIDAAKLFLLTKEWIGRLEKCIRQKSYTLAPMLFHPAVVWCGVESNICFGLEQTVEEEFKSFWPSTLSFTVDWSKVKIVPEGGTIMIVAPWLSASKIVGAPQKHGRLTLILGIFPGGKLLGLHGHQSLNPVTRMST